LITVIVDGFTGVKMSCTLLSRFDGRDLRV
jgi:hypothetical protein